MLIRSGDFFLRFCETNGRLRKRPDSGVCTVMRMCDCSRLYRISDCSGFIKKLAKGRTAPVHHCWKPPERLLEHKKPLYDRKHPNACSLSHRSYLHKLGIHFNRVEKSQQVTHFPRQQRGSSNLRHLIDERAARWKSNNMWVRT